jgi:hypothetical protein
MLCGEINGAIIYERGGLVQDKNRDHLTAEDAEVAEKNLFRLKSKAISPPAR